MTTNETINQNVDFTVEQVRNILYGCMDNCQRIFKKYDLEDYANWGIAQKKEYFGGKVVIFTSTRAYVIQDISRSCQRYLEGMEIYVHTFRIISESEAKY